MNFLPEYWMAYEQTIHGVMVLLTAGVMLFAAGHAILFKRESHSAISWVTVILFVPIAGGLMYYLLGINRVKRKAAILRIDALTHRAPTAAHEVKSAELEGTLPESSRHLVTLSEAVCRATDRLLVRGNSLEPLRNGDEAFPEMLNAIQEAKSSIALSSYIFDNDPTGRAFADALEAAFTRGVDVRVLVDGIGAHYSYPSIVHLLRKKGVMATKFLPPGRHLSFVNLRNHKKIMVVDGILGFTGGMNIRESMRLNSMPRNPVQDLHFKVQGPVVAHLLESFADDWYFCTGDKLDGDLWFPEQKQSGDVIARGITDGPDEDLDKLRWTLLAALSNAQKSIRIMTPYFLPDLPLITSLNLAAMRGVKVDIILPEKNNLPFVMWATRAMLWQVLEYGCRVSLTKPPFDHSKLMLVDDCWTLIGSSNWDARTLQLNFEFNLECYNPGLALQMNEIVDARMISSRQVTLKDMDERSLPARLRDGTARLFSPYL